jgi:uncharacterized DUF497 family protein
MSEPLIHWDPKKEDFNREKHGISFEEAKSVFYDQSAELIHDSDHSKDEDRFILLSFSSMLRRFVICHCYRENESTIRTFSACMATKSEGNNYPRSI